MDRDTTYAYQGYLITISPQLRRGKTVYYFLVNGHRVDFVSNPDTAKRYAINFIDVKSDPDFKTSWNLSEYK